MSGGRIRQILLLATFLPWCWLMMMVVHEAGHVLMAWMTDATVERVVLHPLAISRTDLSENPHPLLVSWAGAIFGSLMPLHVWLMLWSLRLAVAPFVRFFAGFCLVANGVYLGMGAWTGDGDAGDLLRYGASLWHLILFGMVATGGGMWCWHGLGTTFGFANQHESITWRTIFSAVAALALTVMLELLLSPI